MSLLRIRIGTRKSALALAQAEEVRALLRGAWPQLEEPGAIEVVHIVTSGDRYADRPLADVGGKGLFTKEIEEALLRGDIDIGVHSAKDMQALLPHGLIIGAVPHRADPRDALIARIPATVAGLPHGVRVGTSSPRRAAQMRIARPDCKILPLRGNVETRIRKLEQGEADATLLAVAGLKRLGLASAGLPLDTDEMLPAVGQGALGIECREGDDNTLALLDAVNHPPSATEVACERALLSALGGSCRTAIAGLATASNEKLRLRVWVARPDGTQPHRYECSGAIADAVAMGQTAGEILLARAGENFFSE